MEIKDIKYIYNQINTNSTFDEHIRNYVLKNKKTLKSHITKTIYIVIVLVIIGITNVTAYAFSGDYRDLLANILHINSKETHYIGGQSCNNGIKMTVVSSHVVNKTAVILITFEKENGEEFRNYMNPVLNKFMVNDKVIDTGFSGEYSELSADSKILNCYFSWSFSDKVIDEYAEISISELLCSQSQIDGSVWMDQLIEGEWSVSFRLLEDTDNTLTIINDDISDTVSMCGKELQIKSIMISDMLLQVNTIILNETVMQFDPVSNVYMNSGSYNGVYLRLKYNDGTISNRIECFLDSENNIVAFIPETIDKSKIIEIYVGDILIIV